MKKLLFLLLFVFVLCFSAISYATDDMILVDFPGGDTSNNRADLLEDILSYTGLDNYSFYSSDSETQYNSAKSSGFVNPNNLATYRFVKLSGGGYSLELSYSTNDKVVQGATTEVNTHSYIPTKRFSYNIQNNNTLRVVWNSYNSGTKVDTVPSSGFEGYYILCQLPGGWYEYRYNVDFTVTSYSNLTWNKNTSSTIAVTSNGVTKDIPLYKYSRSVNSFKLGTFTNWADTHIELSVGPYVADNVIDASWGKATINKYGDIQNGNKIGFVKNGTNLEVWCSLPFYLYDQTYGLTYAYRKNSSQPWQNGYFDFVIMPYGSTDTTANLVNPELDNNTDVGFVNQIDYLLNSGDVNNYDSNSVFGFPAGLWSGDYSGDYGVITEQFIDYDSKNFKIGTFFTNIIRNFINIFTTTENTTISFGSASVNSASFDVLPSGLKVFISFIVNAICFLYILKYLYRLFYTISTFNLTQFLNDNSIDVSNFF